MGGGVSERAGQKGAAPGRGRLGGGTQPLRLGRPLESGGAPSGWEHSGNPTDATLGTLPALGSCSVRVQARMPSLPAPRGKPVTHCRGVSPVCVRRCTSRWFFLLKDLPQVSQVNSRTPGGDAGLSRPPSREGFVGSLRHCRDPVVRKAPGRRQTKAHILWARMPTIIAKAARTKDSYGPARGSQAAQERDWAEQECVLGSLRYTGCKLPS